MTPLELYSYLVQSIGDGTGQSDTVLHIHGGLAVLMLARIVTGRSLGGLLPFWFVLAAGVLKELLDRLVYGSWRWTDSLLDMGNTLFWPLVISVAIRLRPMIGRDREVASLPLDDAS
jgi:hypothetical protein